MEFTVSSYFKSLIVIQLFNSRCAWILFLTSFFFFGRDRPLLTLFSFFWIVFKNPLCAPYNHVLQEISVWDSFQEIKAQFFPIFFCSIVRFLGTILAWLILVLVWFKCNLQLFTPWFGGLATQKFVLFPHYLFSKLKVFQNGFHLQWTHGLNLRFFQIVWYTSSLIIFFTDFVYYTNLCKLLSCTKRTNIFTFDSEEILFICYIYLFSVK